MFVPASVSKDLGDSQDLSVKCQMIKDVQLQNQQYTAKTAGLYGEHSIFGNDIKSIC